VQEAQATITSSEFVEWVWFLEWKDTKEFRREDYYLAQITAMIERTNVKNPPPFDRAIKAKLLNFSPTKTNTPKGKQQMSNSKSFWKSAVGLLQPGGKKRGGRK